MEPQGTTPLGEFLPPPKDNTEKIKLAARLRVEGNSWTIIAKHIGRANEDSAQHIIHEYPEEWKAAYAYAYAMYLDEIEAEASVTERELMRPLRRLYTGEGKVKTDEHGYPVMVARDEKLRDSAANHLLVHASKMRVAHINVHHTGETTGKLVLSLETFDPRDQAKSKPEAEAVPGQPED